MHTLKVCWASTSFNLKHISDVTSRTSSASHFHTVSFFLFFSLHSVLGIDKFNLDRMPGGTASVELRKPIEVAAHVKAYGTKSNGNGNGNGNGNQVSTPLISEDGTIELPATVTAFDVLLEISAE